MTTVLLVRHGLTALTGPVLTGWTPGVHLDAQGRAQAEALAVRLAPVPLDLIVTSPLERCMETAAAIAAARDGRAEITVRLDERLGECRYGDWTGQRLKKLAKDPLWRVVQVHPSAARFPGPDGEALPQMQYRAVSAIREWNARLGRDACYLISSHGDVIKAIVADSLGLHLDQFQRIQIDPCSLTVVRYTPLRPFVLRLNDTGGGVTDLAVAARRGGGESDAMVGGGAGGGAGRPGDSAEAAARDAARARARSAAGAAPGDAGGAAGAAGAARDAAAASPDHAAGGRTDFTGAGSPSRHKPADARG